MKKVILSLTIVLGTLVMFGQEIDFFNGGFDVALEKAKQENKLVFIDFYTSWCGPCKTMAEEVFTIDDVGHFFNVNFISLKVQTDKNESLAKIGKMFDVKAYPTLIWLNPEGEQIHRVRGAQDKNELLIEAEKALLKK